MNVSVQPLSPAYGTGTGYAQPPSPAYGTGTGYAQPPPPAYGPGTASAVGMNASCTTKLSVAK